jgi:hypothetical protein
MFLILCTCLVSAQETTVSEKGYACLETRVAGECDSLSTEERIFSLLTIDRCKTEVIEDSHNNQCWPDSDCSIKTTAQAILALSLVGTTTVDAENWLLSQEISPLDVDWLLQIEPTNFPASCDISSETSSGTISIKEDRKISDSPGSCLDITPDEYWLEIDSDCYNDEFEISCDSNSFSTSLLYQKQDSDVIYISKDTSSASAGGSTKEKINSFCFKKGTSSCDYEGTLWAAHILKLKGYDTSFYLPYLITMADKNQEFIPESFLYSLTGSFKDELLLKQQQGQWWYESERLYDTAVALFSLQQEESSEKTGSKGWLEEIQGDDGCWENNLRNTAFILFSVWPKKTLTMPEQKPDCEDEGYCMTSNACQESGGETLVAYGGCFLANVCCSVESLLPSCLRQEGERCLSGEICSGEIIEAVDTEQCCIDGECVEIEEEEEDESECEVYGGECKSVCSSNEESKNYDCPSFDVCCVSESKTNYTLVIILGILIVLTVIGILFRKKLRKFWLKFKSKFKGKKSPKGPKGPRRFPPGPSSSIAQRTRPRRMLPPTQRPVRRPIPRQRPSGELDNVLKKLKEMGK